MMQNRTMQLLTLKNVEVQTGSGDWETIKGYIQKYFDGRTAGTLVIMHHGTCMGRLENQEFAMPGWLPLEPEYLRSIRVFNRESECYIWRSSMDEPGIFRFRFIHDEGINETNGEPLIEVRQLLWGTSLEIFPDEEKWAVLKEKQGIELLIHRALLPPGVELSTKNRLWLITHNYIDYTPFGQAGYVDCRFVGIEGDRGMGQ